MPRKISEIKETSPKSSLENFQNDPAENSVLGNIKLLSETLAKYPQDKQMTELGERLADIMAGVAGTQDEGLVNRKIELLRPYLHGIYLSKIVNDNTKVKDEKEHAALKKQLQYVAAGLGFYEGFDITQEQKDNIARNDIQGRRQVHEERQQEEESARRKAVEGKSALNVLDEHKAALGKLPKSFRGPNAVSQEEDARQKLEALCIDILATRRAVEAQRNNKSALAKATIDPELLHSYKNEFSQSGSLAGFFKSMSYKDLHSLATSGHGGAMEDKLTAYVKDDLSAIPADTPYHYLPTARQRTEALQDKMDRLSFKNSPPGEQRKLYIELLATRAAVNSKRGDKTTLDKKLNGKILKEEREKFSKEPLHTALVRVTEMGDKQQASYNAALSGHGGALEDRLRAELRRMAVEKDNGYKLQNVDPRFAPTAEQRYADIQALMNAKKLSDPEKLRLTTEAGMLQEMINDGKGTEPLANIESLNRQVDTRTELYSKVMDTKSLKDFIDGTFKDGYDRACSKFEAAHAGPLKAIRVEEEINAQLNPELDQDTLAKLAAKKMILLQHKMEYQKDKNGEKLEKALEKANLEKNVDRLMNDYLFKEVCQKLGAEGLSEYTKGDGSQLVESYALAKTDQLQPYNPPVPVVKNEQKNIAIEGPQDPVL